MATREELLDMLRKAHAAGATEHAQRIAGMIRDLPAQAEASPAKGEPAAPITPPAETSAPLAPTAARKARRDTQVADAMASQVEGTTEDKLRSDPEWVAASKIIYKMNKGLSADENISDLEVADYGLDEIGWFNTNIAQMGIKAGRNVVASPEEQSAFLYLMDNSEALNWSWEGAGRLFKGIITDPTTYVGIASLGLGTAAAQGGKLLSRAAFKETLKMGARAGAIAAVDGAIISGSDNSIRQGVRITGNEQDGFDGGQLATSVAVGAAAGLVLGGAVGSVAHTVSHVKANKAIQEAEAIFAPQPTPKADVAQPKSAAAPAPAAKAAAAPAKASEGLTPVAKASPANTVREHLSTIVREIKALAPDGPIRVVNGTQSMAALSAATKDISVLIEKAAQLGKGENLTTALMRTGIKSSQLQVLKHSAQQANDAMLSKTVTLIKQFKATTDKASIKNIAAQVLKLEDMRTAIQALDDQLSAQSGRDLRIRQEGLNVGELRGVTVQGLMTEGNLSQKQAMNALEHLHDVRVKERDVQKAVQTIDTKLRAASDAGDFLEVQKLNAEKKTVLGKTDTQKAGDGTPVGRIARMFHRALEGVLEIMISNVFSPSTLIINTIPTYAKIMTKPFLNYVVRGVLDPAEFAGMIASYTAMHSMTGTSFKAGIAAFRYEKALLLHDSERVFMGTGVLPKKIGGGVLRFFPRMLNATDEFMGQMAYRSYGVGQITAAAVGDASDKGLTGKAAEDFIRKAVKDGTEKLYTVDASKDKVVTDMLIEQAQDRGLSGDELNRWVRGELNKNADVLRQAESESGRSYTKDLLFKREFSGKTPASKAARGYEKFVQANPLMKIAGQLFFRTPIRVFEEGLRLTPGLNLVYPGFMKDLAGKNGTTRQIRAQGEAMLSYGFAGSVMSLYAAGSITGAGPSDFRQRRQGEDAGNFEPYTITMANGDSWSFRNLDPISTPLKIMVNAMERIQVLQYRIAQGEMNAQSEMDLAVGYMGAGVAAVAQAIADANLLQGVANVTDFFSSLTDDQSGNNGDKVVKAIGGFLATAVPSTFTKVRAAASETTMMPDAITIEQILRAKINPNDPLVPKQYTALGTPRLLANPAANLYIFNPSSPEERQRGMSEKEQAVQKELWMLTQVANVNFTPQYKHKFLPDVGDLRKSLTKDGKESLYDRWQFYVTKTDLVDQLYAITQQDLPAGVPGASPRTDAIRKVLLAYRDSAMLRLVREETGDAMRSMTDAATFELLQKTNRNVSVPFQ